MTPFECLYGYVTRLICIEKIWLSCMHEHMLRSCKKYDNKPHMNKSISISYACKINCIIESMYVKLEECNDRQQCRYKDMQSHSIHVGGNDLEGEKSDQDEYVLDGRVENHKRRRGFNCMWCHKRIKKNLDKRE